MAKLNQRDREIRRIAIIIGRHMNHLVLSDDNASLNNAANAIYWHNKRKNERANLVAKRKPCKIVKSKSKLHGIS